MHGQWGKVVIYYIFLTKKKANMRKAVVIILISFLERFFYMEIFLFILACSFMRGL